MPRGRTTVVSLTVIALLPGATGPAAADGGGLTHGTSAGPTEDGARALCKRAVRIDKRIDKALTRLNGP